MGGAANRFWPTVKMATGTAHAYTPPTWALPVRRQHRWPGGTDAGMRLKAALMQSPFIGVSDSCSIQHTKRENPFT